jgi:hypothetical protein
MKFLSRMLLKATLVGLLSIGGPDIALLQQSAPSAENARSAKPSIAAYGVASAQALPQRPGSFAQVAVGYVDGGSWDTDLVFGNIGTSPATVTVRAYASDGSPLALPVVGSESSAEYQFAIPANGSAYVDFDHTASPLKVGWLDVMMSSSHIRGQGIFTQRVDGRPDSQAVVPLVTRDPAACLVSLPGDTRSMPDVLVMPFDNTGNYVTSVAYANTSSVPLDRKLRFIGEDGKIVGEYPLQLPARGHMAVATPDSYSEARGKRGMIYVVNNSPSDMTLPKDMTAIGFLFRTDVGGGAFTTIMPIVR